VGCVKLKIQWYFDIHNIVNACAIEGNAQKSNSIRSISVICSHNEILY